MGKSAFQITFDAVQSESEALNKITVALKEADSLQALIGVTHESNGRDEDTGITNADLLYIHTHGSPINNIPPRDVLESSLAHSKDEVAQLLEAVTQAAFNGDVAGVHKAMEKAGLQGQNIARAWFTNPANGWAPNKTFTIEGGWSRNKVSGKAFHAKGKKSSKPLIDTGELRKAITYTIREKGKSK